MRVPRAPLEPMDRDELRAGERARVGEALVFDDVRQGDRVLRAVLHVDDELVAADAAGRAVRGRRGHALDVVIPFVPAQLRTRATRARAARITTLTLFHAGAVANEATAHKRPRRILKTPRVASLETLDKLELHPCAMLDHVSVFTKTGVVLWSRTMAKLKGTTNPVNTLIADVLLEEKGGGTRSHTIDQYTLRWRLVNELELVIVVVYQKILQLLYVDDLLEAVAREIVTRFGDGLRGNPSAGRVPRLAFDEAFDRLQRDSETRQRSQLKAEQERQRDAAKPATVGGVGDDGDTGDGGAAAAMTTRRRGRGRRGGDEALDEGAKRQAALDRLSKRGARPRRRQPRKGAAAGAGAATAEEGEGGQEDDAVARWHREEAEQEGRRRADFRSATCRASGGRRRGGAHPGDEGDVPA